MIDILKLIKKNKLIIRYKAELPSITEEVRKAFSQYQSCEQFLSNYISRFKYKPGNNNIDIERMLKQEESDCFGISYLLYFFCKEFFPEEEFGLVFLKNLENSKGHVVFLTKNFIYSFKNTYSTSLKKGNKIVLILYKDYFYTGVSNDN